jgi:hypothetical protein
MSIDMASATQSATALLANSSLAGSAPGIPSKASWRTQIIGAYDLMFPSMHLDIPTRDEVLVAIQSTISVHHATTPHFGSGSFPGGATNAIPTIISPVTAPGGPSLVRAIGDNVMVSGYGIGGV